MFDNIVDLQKINNIVEHSYWCHPLPNKLKIRMKYCLLSVFYANNKKFTMKFVQRKKKILSSCFKSLFVCGIEIKVVERYTCWFIVKYKDYGETR